MAAEPQRAMSGNALTRKVGPLPVWGWAVGLLVAYFLYQHYKGSAAANTSTTAGTSTDTSGADMNPVPVGTPNTDSSLGGGGFGGGPTTINNYYGSNPADTGGTGAGSRPTPQPVTGGPQPVITPVTPPDATFGSSPPQFPGGVVPIQWPTSSSAGVSGVPGGPGSVKVSGGRLTQ